jgi:sugar lactone lactonase YvrE
MKELNATLLASDFIFLEAPRWHDGRVWVPDVFDGKLYSVGLDGRREIVLDDLPPKPNSIGFMPDGTLVIVSSQDRKLLKLVDGRLQLHADLSNFATGDVNDFAIDDTGRIYVGNFGYDIFAGEPIALTSIHIVEQDGSIRVAATDLEFPNGTVIIDNGRTLVVAETWAGRLTAFDRDATGNLSNRRLYADLPGREPDGICADAEGAIWVPSFNTGEVLRLEAGATITHRISFKGSAIACQLGGADGRTLICTAYDGTIPEQQAKKRMGALYTARVDVPGPGFAR